MLLFRRLAIRVYELRTLTRTTFVKAGCPLTVGPETREDVIIAALES